MSGSSVIVFASYPLADVQENARLIRVGMTEGLRLQFKLSLI